MVRKKKEKNNLLHGEIVRLVLSKFFREIKYIHNETAKNKKAKV